MLAYVLCSPLHPGHLSPILQCPELQQWHHPSEAFVPSTDDIPCVPCLPGLLQLQHPRWNQMCHHWMGQDGPNLWVISLFESLTLGQYLQCKFTKVWTFPSPQMTCITALLNIPHTPQRKYSSVPYLSLYFQYFFSKPTLPPADCSASAHPYSVQAVLGLQQNHRRHDLCWCFWSVLLSGSNQYNSWNMENERLFKNQLNCS